MLNNKTVLIWCHFLDHNCIFVFQAIFLHCMSTYCRTERLDNQTFYVLCVIEFQLSFINQKQSLKVLSGDFPLIFVLKNTASIKQFSEAFVFIVQIEDTMTFSLLQHLPKIVDRCFLK